MDAPIISTLEVPCARLYYEVRGAGPVVLLIAGGSGDSGHFERVANEIADRYTVVTYDRRGFSRSTLGGLPDDRPRLEADSDDAQRLLDRLADGPAFVFGSSSGAIVALDLIARHPERIRILVAHEPPLVRLLPDAKQQLEFLDEVYDTYRSSGVDLAMRKFSTGVGLGDLAQPPEGIELPPHVAEMLSRIHGNQAFWLEHELRQYTRVVPDISALRSASTRLVLAGGLESQDYFPYRPNTIMAVRLDSKVVDFPGGHVGYVTHPIEFAARLTDVLAATDTKR